jgi:nitrate reductase NapAB chaperone NapD
MSILGALVRLKPADLPAVSTRIAALPGVDVAADPGDGRLVLVIEDAQVDGQLRGAGATLAGIAAMPDVLNTSLVYEYSGDEAPDTVTDYRDWRGTLARAGRALDSAQSCQAQGPEKQP